MNRFRRPRPNYRLRALLGLVAASTLLVAPHAGTQEYGGSGRAGLGGFQGTAGAYGVKVFYFPDGSALPIGSLVDIGVPDAHATIATGPATFARASSADPGDLIANPNALLGQLDPEAPRVPEYPFRISARSASDTPETSQTPLPGLESSVKALADGSIATSSIAEVQAPPVLTVGGVETTAETTTDGSTVTVHARTEIGRIDVLGVLTLEGVVVDVTATSDGETTTSDGGATVGKATVLGTPVVIDSDGMRTDDGADEPTIPIIGELLDGLLGGGGNGEAGVLSALEDAGLEISVAGPRDYEIEGAAGLAATGLRIDISFSDETIPGLTELIESLPPIENPVPGLPGVEDLLAVVQANNLFAVELGGAYVDLSARPGFEFESPAPPSTSPPSQSPTPSPSSGGSSGPTSSPSSGSTPSTTAAPAPSPSSGVAADSSTPVSLSAGIGALALAALLLQPLVGDRLGRAAGFILAADQPGTCPREGQ